MHRESDHVERATAGDGSLYDAGEVNALREELAATVDKWHRAAADVDNLQKRFQRELARGQTAERDRVLLSWVGTIDDLDRAVVHADVGAGDQVDGLRAVLRQAVASIASFGYSRFGEVGDQFDAALHDVVSTVPATHELAANAVVAVVKAGYGTVEHLLRPATVVVAKGPD